MLGTPSSDIFWGALLRHMLRKICTSSHSFFSLIDRFVDCFVFLLPVIYDEPRVRGYVRMSIKQRRGPAQSSKHSLAPSFSELCGAERSGGEVRAERGI